MQKINDARLEFGDLQFEDFAFLKSTRNVFIQKLYMLRQAKIDEKYTDHQPNSSRRLESQGYSISWKEAAQDIS